MVPADAPTEGLGWAFFFFFSSRSRFLSFKATPALSFLLSLYYQTLAGSYGHETLLPLPAPKEENGGERCREHRGKEARGRAPRPCSPPDPRAAPPPPPPLGTRCQTFPAPSRLLLPAVCVCACVCVCVCVCVCGGGGGRRCLSQAPLPLENAKESLLPQLPLLSPAARSPTPTPKSQTPDSRAPLPFPLGSVGAPECRFVPGWDGDPGARSAPCSALTVSGRCPGFTLQARVSPRALGPRRTVESSRGPDRAEGGTWAPPTDPSAQIRARERSAVQVCEPPRGRLLRGGSWGRGHLQNQGQRPRLPQPSPRGRWRRRAARCGGKGGLQPLVRQQFPGGRSSSADCALPARLQQPSSCPFSTLELARSPRAPLGFVSQEGKLCSLASL